MKPMILNNSLPHPIASQDRRLTQIVRALGGVARAWKQNHFPLNAACSFVTTACSAFSLDQSWTSRTSLERARLVLTRQVLEGEDQSEKFRPIAQICDGLTPDEASGSA